MKRLVIGLCLIVLSMAPALTIIIDVYASANSSSILPSLVSRFNISDSYSLDDPQLMEHYALSADVDTDGNVCLPLIFANKVECFTSEGDLKLTLGGEPGSGDGEFAGLGSVYSLTIDGEGNIYVADTGNLRIQKFSANGSFLAKWEGTEEDPYKYTATTLLADKNNNRIYLYGGANNNLRELTLDGQYVRSFSLIPPDGRYDDPEAFERAVRSISVGADGSIYSLEQVSTLTYDEETSSTMVSTLGEVVRKFTSAGDYVSIVTDATIEDSETLNMTSITVDDDNNLYILTTNDGNALTVALKKFDSDGNFLGESNLVESGDTVDFLPLMIVATGTKLYGYGYSDLTLDSEGNPSSLSVGIGTYDSARNSIELHSPVTQDKVVVALPEGSSVVSSSVAAATKRDDGYNYPLGLLSFAFATPGGQHGVTASVTVIFQTELKPSDVVARKYNAITGAYGNIPGAVITETVVDGKHALQLTYDIVDGGELDEDGIANGVIVDPVGLGIVNIPGAPNTGLARQALMPLMVIYAVVIPLLIAFLIALLHRRDYRQR